MRHPQHHELRNRTSPYGGQPQRQERTAAADPAASSGYSGVPCHQRAGPSSAGGGGYDVGGRLHHAEWLQQRSPPRIPESPPGGHGAASAADPGPQYLAAHLRSPDPRLPSPIPERCSSPPHQLQQQPEDSRTALLRSPPPLMPVPGSRDRHNQYRHPLQSQYADPHYRLQEGAATAVAVKTEPMEPFQSSPWATLDRRRTPTPPAASQQQLPLGIPALPKQEPPDVETQQPVNRPPPRGGSSYLHKILKHRERHQTSLPGEESRVQERQQQYLEAVKRLQQSSSEAPPSTAAGGQYPYTHSSSNRDSPKMRRHSGPLTLAQYHHPSPLPPPPSHPPPPPHALAGAPLISGTQSMLLCSTVIGTSVECTQLSSAPV